MLALSIRQPFAELILRGIKTVELRSRATNVIGRRFHIYACKAEASTPIWSRDLRAGEPPEWMIELAGQVKMIEPGAMLPTGVIVGSAVIERCEPIERAIPHSAFRAPHLYEWHLTDVRRAKRLRKPKGHPQPVWFRT